MRPVSNVAIRQASKPMKSKVMPPSFRAWLMSARDMLPLRGFFSS